MAVGDGALGFWKALSKVYDNTRWQRCWVHKTANVLNKLPKSIQAKAKEKLHQIWMASKKDEAEKHFDDFIEIYEAKYPKATECLKKERYRGILICTTNRLKGLDNASIRRFNYKIGFNYLKPNGNVIFYQKFLEPLTVTSLDKVSKEALKKIIDLAPGDFKVVRDKNFFHRSKELSPQSLVQALREEAEVKRFHKGRKHIGF